VERHCGLIRFMSRRLVGSTYSLEISTADDGPAISVSESQRPRGKSGSVGMWYYRSRRCTLFIEERTGTDRIVDNVPVQSHWLRDRRTSYCAGLLVSKFTSA